MRTLALPWMIAAAAPLPAQTPITDTLYSDLNLTPIGAPIASEPTGFIGNGQVVYFAADQTGTARELWVSDGTEAGTRPLTSSGSNNFDSLFPGSEQWGAFVPGAGNRFVFCAQKLQFVPNFELYVAEGLGQPASLLKDISGFDNSWPRDFITHGGQVYFLARESQTGLELWRSDGTSAGTQLAVELLPGPGSLFTEQFTQPGSFPSGHIASAGALLLAAGLNGAQAELYATDGASAPSLVAQFPGGFDPLFFRPDRFARVGNRLLFTVRTPDAAVNGVWVSDGSPAGTQRLLAGRRVRWARSDGSRAFLAVLGGAGGQDELYVSDGTLAGTQLLAGQGLPLAQPGVTPGVFFAGKFYFAAEVNQSPQGAVGRELAVSDGTPAGTALFADLFPGANGSSPRDFGVDAGGFYCFAELPGVGRELVRSDGTLAGTALLQDIVPGPASGSALPTLQPSQPFALYAPTSNGLLFAYDDTQAGLEPWRLTAQGATPLASFLMQTSAGSMPQDLTRVGDRLFFTAKTGPAAQRELWWLDAGAGGLPQRAEASGTFGLDAGSPVAFNGGVAFSGSLPGAGNRYAVWWTAGGGALVRLTALDLLGPAQELVDAGSRLYFFATPDAPNVGNELWWSNGAPLAATLLNLSAGAESTALPSDAEMVAFGAGVAFRWNAGSHGQGTELGLSNGVFATRIDINPGASSSNPSQLTRAGTKLFFSATNNFGTEVWASDGTPIGTQLLIDWASGGAGSNPTQLTAVGNRLVWGASVIPCCPIGIPTFSLLVSDGTPGGTLSVLPTQLLGAASDGSRALLQTGNGIYTTDGTFAGTQLALPSLAPGTINPFFASNAGAIAALAPGLFALAGVSGGGNNLELWISDGTIAGSFQVADSLFGPGGSSPGQGGEIVRVGEQVFFSANLPWTGSELHSVDFGATGGAIAAVQGAGCGSAASGLSASAEPRLGQPLALQVSSAAPAAPVALYFDLDLAPLGPTGGCPILLPNATFLLGGTTGAAGQATFPLLIGTNPNLVGQALYLQGAVLAVGEPFLGLVSLTNALEILIGP